MNGGSRQRFGQGDFSYELVEDWATLPDGWSMPFAAPAIASDGCIYLFTRSEHPVIVLDPTGRFLATWGEGELTSAHHISIDGEDNLLLPVVSSHVVLKCNRQGDVLLTLGHRDRPSNPDWNGSLYQWMHEPTPRAYEPFCLPTGASTGPDGSIYVSDGYANARIHRFSASGVHLTSWGRPGREGEGAFFTPHSVCVHASGRVLVSDRQNDRIQVFDADGVYLEEWTGLREPCDIAIADDIVYIAEGAGATKRGGLVQIRSLDGETLARWDNFRGSRGAHDICVDARGDLYVNHLLDGDRRLLKYRRCG